jgi:hypothetical protein
MLRKLQEELKSTEKFYEKFFTSKEGKSALDSVYKRFYPIDKQFEDTSNLELSIDFKNSFSIMKLKEFLYVSTSFKCK